MTDENKRGRGSIRGGVEGERIKQEGGGDGNGIRPAVCFFSQLQTE